MAANTSYGDTALWQAAAAGEHAAFVSAGTPTVAASCPPGEQNCWVTLKLTVPSRAHVGLTRVRRTSGSHTSPVAAPPPRTRGTSA